LHSRFNPHRAFDAGFDISLAGLPPSGTSTALGLISIIGFAWLIGEVEQLDKK
jgi:hypothetical protein